ncbi:MAG: hypothetical protein ACFCGT_01770 [Sandaracinaceae bacterium]
MSAPAPAMLGGARPGLLTRAVALLFLVLVVVGSGAAVVAVATLLTDAWIAPANLSPEHDRVIQLHLQVDRTTAEVDRAEAEVTRIDEQVAAIDVALSRLARLRDNSREMFLWGAEERARVVAATREALASLEREREVLARLVERQERIAARTRAHHEEALVGRAELEREEQALDRLRLSVAANQRALGEARQTLAQSSAEREALRASADGEVGASPHAPGRLPLSVQRQEQMTRLDLEIVQLEAERRGLVATRRAAERNLGEVRDVLDQLRSRPLWQATERSLDVAFVPYAQLEGVAEGDDVIHCVWMVAGCRRVGRVADILPGEVVTQDPWGELARGRYAVLALSDPAAVRERILRVRRPR